MEGFTEYGYVGLFLAALLAATILPLSSEAVLGALLLNGWDASVLVAVATTGNVLGAFTNYALGYWGSKAFVRRVLRTSEEDFEKAERRFRKYGVMSLLFAWVPVIGDPLTLVAGVLRINIWVFFVLVTAGKLARYLTVSYLVLQP